MSLIRVNDVGRADIKREYEEFWTEMKPYVADAVEKSFLTAKMSNPTMSEIKSRSNLAKRLVDQLRHEFRWSKQRIRDNISMLLRAELIGIKIDLSSLDQRGSW
jgi:hypothetical protein